MFSPFERMVAMRYLRARRKEGFISVIAGFSLLGIALGVATLIIVMSVMNGFRHELLGRILGLNGHLTMEAYKGPLPDYDRLTDELRKLPIVKMADPLVQGQAMVTVKDRAIGAVVRGMRPEDVKARAIFADNIKAGSLERFHGEDVVIIGSRMAESLGVSVGDQITLISPQSTATLIGLIPRIKAYDVVGIFEVGMSEYDSGFVFMPLEAAQLYFKLPGAASDIEITVEDPDRIAAAVDAIEAKVGSNFRFIDWQEANSSFFGAIQVERNVMFLILTLIIVVAAFNIISGQIMLVKDKGRDIAILRTMGATRGMIMHLPLERREHRRARHGARLRLRRGLRRQYRIDPPVAPDPAAHASLSRGDLFPLPAAGHRRSRRGGDGRDHVADPLAARHPLSVLAGGKARSGRGAAL